MSWWDDILGFFDSGSSDSTGLPWDTGGEGTVVSTGGGKEADFFTANRGWLNPVLQTGLQTAGMLFQQGAQKDSAKAALEAKKQDAILQLELEKLKHQYGLTGKTGGGGGGGGGADRSGQLLQAYQQYSNGLANASNATRGVYGNLGAGMANSYNSVRR